MAGRRCPGRDEVDGRTRACPTILTNGERRCARHAKAYEVRRGSSTERGYGSAHQRERARIQDEINTGKTVRCWVCDTQLHGRAWHLDHTVDRTGYRGPACIGCNTSDGGQRGARTANARD